jgi:hypothetical protein
MKRPLALAFTAIVVAMCALTAMSQPPEGRGPGGKKGGPPGFELGRVLPPFVRDDLDLTADQERQIAALEEEVKQKLETILTAEQRKMAAGARPPFGPPMSKDGPPPGGFGPGGRGKDGPPPKKDDGEQARAGGVQWFATWEAGKAEAERTGRPILFVSAAPHCAGVPGIW